MKLPGILLFVPMSREMEALYTQTTRKRFVPFVRFCLIGAFLNDGLRLLWQYVHNEPLYYVDLSLILLTFYTVLLAVTFIPGSVRFIHAIGVIAITGIIFSIAFMVSNAEKDFEDYLALFLIPLQLVPVMTSLVASMATIWLSVVIIFDFAEKSGATAASITTLRSLLAYYIFISTLIAFAATQYRRASFKLEKNLEQARRDAETANEAKSTFLATMSHEVRTPLNGILGLITLMKDTVLDTQQKDYVETIKYSGETLLTILNDILDFSKMEAGKFDLEEVNFNVERLVSSVVMLMESRAKEKGLQFDYKVNDDVPSHIRSDPTRIRQVLLNLTGNAIKFTESGFVHVHVSATRGDGDSALISFEVSDTGIGISDDAQKNLFQEFAQADSSISRKYGGTGLGLAICKKIIELMQGRIGVLSTAGRGSTFWFEVPAIVAESAHHQGDETTLQLAADAIPVFNPISILVAEDNAINQKVIAGLLERCGHIVSFANNGQIAIDMLQTPGKTYGLVLMDMQMPVMDGLTASARIRTLGGDARDVPIIALTANTVKGDEQRCLAAGMNGYVSKPIDPKALYQAISKHVPSSVVQGQVQQTSSVRRRSTNSSFEHLEKIERMMGSDYVKKFTEDGLQEVRDLINTVCVGSNAKVMKRAAHDLKSLSSMFGLNDVQALAEGIELCCAENSTEEALVLGKLLQDRYQNDVSMLRKAYLAHV